jgi:hypothetical protein
MWSIEHIYAQIKALVRWEDIKRHSSLSKPTSNLAQQLEKMARASVLLGLEQGIV